MIKVSTAKFMVDVIRDGVQSSKSVSPTLTSALSYARRILKEQNSNAHHTRCHLVVRNGNQLIMLASADWRGAARIRAIA